MTPAACRHCRRARAGRSRGLCWGCYYAPGVRDGYPPTTADGRRGVPSPHGPARLPDPTAARPGTADKLAELARRAELGLALSHPADARADLR